MFDEKLYSLTVINAEESIRRAETAINSANSNVVKWGHSMVKHPQKPMQAYNLVSNLLRKIF